MADTPITIQDAMSIGFKGLPHFTIGRNLIYDLGRKRELSIACIGTSNEVLFMCQLDDDKNTTDLICLHNWDYDGFLTIEKLKAIITALIV